MYQETIALRFRDGDKELSTSFSFTTGSVRYVNDIAQAHIAQAHEGQM